MSVTVGIDLGTTFSVVSYIDKTTKKAVILKNRSGNSTTPSVIGFNEDGSYIIGEDAKDREKIGDTNTASFYKLHMGDHSYKYCFYGKEYTACELSSLFLKRLAEESEKMLGEKINDAVITVPAYFDDIAKNDTLLAGQSAGLHVLNIISEPTAACVAYGLNKSSSNQKILIYDLGGGTFDITIAEINEDFIKVLATNGQHQLGGKDWDQEIVSWMNEKYYEQTGRDIAEDEEVAAMNMVKAEKAKIQLTYSNETDVIIDDGMEKVRAVITRDEFENLTSYQLEITADLIDETFHELGIGWHDIQGVVLVGGSTKMPMVHNYLEKCGVKILKGIHPDEAVAIGAAIQANIGKYCSMTLAGKSSSSMELTFVGNDEKLELGNLPGAKIIEDVISHSLGMVSISEDESCYLNDIMILKNTPYNKANETKVRELKVSTIKERNTLDIYLLQGESKDPLDCSIIKKYVFRNIDYVEGGRSRIAITYKHTYNGTVDISAVQQETGEMLTAYEDNIPEDMSWLGGSPKAVVSQNKDKIHGAIVLALDVSGSMEKSILVAKKAMHNFVNQFKDMDVSFGIVAFSDIVAASCNVTKKHKIVDRAIDAIMPGRILNKLAQINGGMTLGFGNMSSPVNMVYQMLKPFEGKPFVYALILTDGVWHPSACSEALADKANFVQSGFEIIGLGFGDADINFLRQLSTRDDLAKVEDISRLDANLNSIARIIS